MDLKGLWHFTFSCIHLSIHSFIPKKTVLRFHTFWTPHLLRSLKSYLRDGQDEGSKDTGHPARAQEVDDKPGQQLHSQDVAQQECKESGIRFKQPHVLRRLAQGSEVLDQLGLWQGSSPADEEAGTAIVSRNLPLRP